MMQKENAYAFCHMSSRSNIFISSFASLYRQSFQSSFSTEISRSRKSTIPRAN
eukprot:JP438344.1.p2 GENE.JP438344.1~~JP438344.1.p2  ORF type:complete len:53 (+),score=2.74 JP438344.1:167-325(+)